MRYENMAPQTAKAPRERGRQSAREIREDHEAMLGFVARYKNPQPARTPSPNTHVYEVLAHFNDRV